MTEISRGLLADVYLFLSLSLSLFLSRKCPSPTAKIVKVEFPTKGEERASIHLSYRKTTLILRLALTSP